jgi:hypothetical protein
MGVTGLSVITILCGILFAADNAQQRPKSCGPTPILRDEAEKLLGVVPEVLAAKHEGGKLTFVNWEPGPDYRVRTFYFFQVLSTATSTTVLDNGMIGYFGVNRVTGEVVELNSDKPHVDGIDLKRLQTALRVKHCVNDKLVRANADVPLEK